MPFMSPRFLGNATVTCQNTKRIRPCNLARITPSDDITWVNMLNLSNASMNQREHARSSGLVGSCSPQGAKRNAGTADPGFRLTASRLPHGVAAGDGR